MHRRTIWITLTFVLAGRLLPAQTQGHFRFEDGTSEAGIDFVHSDGASGQRFVIEPMTAGCAVLDYDGDGLDDLYFVNGCALPGTVLERPLQNALYRNRGNGSFIDVTEAAGVGDYGYGLGATAADFDNDGDTDLYISNYGANILYINHGDGTFSDATNYTGTGGGERFGAARPFSIWTATGISICIAPITSSLRLISM